MKQPKNLKTTNLNFYRKVKRFFLNLSNFKVIFLAYFLVTITAALLLWMPISIQEPKRGSVSFLDTLFTAASAFSDTGLITQITAHTWTEFGQAIIAMLILLGGVGIFALKVYIFNVIFNKWLSLNARNVLSKERGAHKSGNLKGTIRVSISALIIMIIISSFVLMFIFYFSDGDFSQTPADAVLNPKGNWAMSFKYGIFHAISALNNAGFDIISSNSLQPYYSVYSIQIVFIILLVIGGIGYPVIYDCWTWLVYKIKRRTDFQFSWFTKLSSATYFIIFAVGFLITVMFEIGSSNGIWNQVVDFPGYSPLGSKGDRMMAIIFHSFSTRNAGFSTTHLQAFTETTLITFSVMMFIGSAPSSTAGGIRTTTLAIILLAVWSKLRGRNDIKIFNRKIPKETVISAFLVLIISLLIVGITTVAALTSMETMWGNAPIEQFSFADVFFEVSSAFGTTGLSSGLTPFLNVGAKLFVILTMFVGQLGISSTILVWKSNKNYTNEIDFVSEDVAIG